MLDGSGSITFDVLTWLNEQKVPLIKIDWTGNVAMVASGESFAANRDRVAWQAETRSNRRKRMEFCNGSSPRRLRAVSSPWRHPFGAPRLGKLQCSERTLTSLASPTIPRRP